jgi:putative acetyltransferase YJL218W
MNNEWNKMLKGEPYDALNAEILDLLFKTKDRIRQYNQLPPSDNEGRETAIRTILGSCGEHPIVNSPFYCDYGCNIHVGDHFFSNFNLTILDEAMVTIEMDYPTPYRCACADEFPQSWPHERQRKT